MKKYMETPPIWQSPTPSLENEPKASFGFVSNWNSAESSSGSDPNLYPKPTEKVRVSAVEAFRFALHDPNLWHNLFFGALMTLIPIAGSIALQGWAIEIRQRLTRNDGHPIPLIVFQDFTHYLRRGVMPFLVVFASGIVNATFNLLRGTLQILTDSLIKSSFSMDIAIVAFAATAVALLIQIMVAYTTSFVVSAVMTADVSSVLKYR